MTTYSQKRYFIYEREEEQSNIEMPLKKIGIMGGTFNPIHIGHLILAEKACEQFHLEKVAFMPSKNPPHKQDKMIIQEEHRCNMIEAAIKENEAFFLYKAELEREGITYTVDTMMELVKKYPDTEYYFIIGGDSLFQIEKWRMPEKLLPMIHLLASAREAISMAEMEKKAKDLRRKYGGQIDLVKMPNIEISSSMLRMLRGHQKSIRYYVPDAVWYYMLEHHLYE